MNACEAGHQEACQILLEHSEKQLDYTCENGTPIHAAITGKDPVNVVKLLLEFKPEIVNQSDLSGVSPLFMAVFVGSLEVTKMLVDKGANPIGLNPDPIQLAV